MKKTIQFLFPIFLILIIPISNCTISYEELSQEKKILYNYLTNYIKSNNFEEFVNILATKEGIKLTQVEKPNIIEIIKGTENLQQDKEKYVRITYVYSLLSEIVEQVKKGTRIKRFKKINNALTAHNSPKLKLKQLKKILTSNREKNRPTSFLWYMNRKIIEPQKILNPCLKTSLEWLYEKLILFLWNNNSMKIKEILGYAPFLITIKRQNYNLKEIAEINLFPQEATEIINLINEIETQFSAREPSIFTAFWRYSLFR